MTPAPVSPHVSVDLVTVAASPLMRAAASLLVLLGRLRASLVRAGPNQLMDQVAQAIEQFEIDARAAGVPSDQIDTAKYALAATADDIVQNLPTAGSGRNTACWFASSTNGWEASVSSRSLSARNKIPW